ncbi:MAG: SDR family oxidoreductase [Anaerolineae bacterium]|nr:SDR family oxidoreductase [Anaerolineae bacterium]
MMKILITGGSSYFGQQLVPLALPDFEVCYTYFQNDPLALPNGYRLEIRDETAVSRLISSFQPDCIIHLAGSNRGADMAAVIVQGTNHVTQAAAQANIRLLHMSTDVVFDGLKPPYDETAVPTPVNAYGQAKAEAEAIVQNYPNHVIIRTSLIYSLEQMDHGTSWMVAALREGKPVTLFNNQLRNPVWATTLGQACLELATNSFTGILHVAGGQTMTRADFSLKMLEWWGITERDTLTIGPSTSGDWPLDLTLDVGKGTAVLQTPLLSVDQVIQLAQTVKNS